MAERKETKLPTGTSEGDGKDDGPRLPPVAMALLAAIVVAGGLFYFWLAFFRNDSAMWSNVGQAVGPFVALLNAGALFAALYSVRLQRYELELQRMELRGHREVMEEQRKQFERTAVAQEELVAAEREMADAQRRTVSFGLESIAQRREANKTSEDAVAAQTDANREAAALRLAQHSNTIALLQGALATLDSIEIGSKTDGTWEAYSPLIDGRRKMLNDRLVAEHKVEHRLRTLIAKGDAQ
jgi:hypothetical protein